jgi:hypothetical protein
MVHVLIKQQNAFFSVLQGDKGSQHCRKKSHRGIFFCNDGCLYHPVKQQRKHFIDYI